MPSVLFFLLSLVQCKAALQFRLPLLLGLGFSFLLVLLVLGRQGLLCLSSHAFLPHLGMNLPLQPLWVWVFFRLSTATRSRTKGKPPRPGSGSGGFGLQ